MENKNIKTIAKEFRAQRFFDENQKQAISSYSSHIASACAEQAIRIAAIIRWE